ncbi:MAG: DUF2796 domain-containing protein [Gammaproteobacteria bacterium]|nr:DUF2796 domain-containing protein [Gammaproteobacteria bacterium]
MQPLSIPTLVLGSAILLAASTPLHAGEEHGHRQHAAHEHGSAKLLLAKEGTELHLEFSSPAMNLVGFEHMPANEQQGEQVRQAIDTLKAANKIFLLPASAGCTLQKVTVETGLSTAEDHSTHAHHEALHEADRHADFLVNYRFSCRDMSVLKQIDVQLFSYFPATRKIDIEMITDQGQRAFELDHNNSKLKL